MDPVFYNINPPATSFYEQHAHGCTDWYNSICTICEIKKLQQLETVPRITLDNNNRACIVLLGRLARVSEWYQTAPGRGSQISSFNPSILTIRVLATLQPRVPAPSRRHFVLTTLSRSREGTSLHLMSFRFKSTDDSASLQPSMKPTENTLCPQGATIQHSRLW